MFDWFGKKRSQPETSAGGSVIHRYPDSKWNSARIGSLGDAAADFTEAREEVYAKFFGKAATVSHEIIPLIPHIDVYTHERGQNGRDFCTEDLDWFRSHHSERQSSRAILGQFCFGHDSSPAANREA
jgi:hypothetical protein